MANIAPDIPPGDVLDTSTMKSISGKDRVLIEQKYVPAYFAYLYAKLIFSANKVPRINDNTLGFWARLKLINFPHTYREHPKPGSEERQADIHLSEKLRAELPGILNWALEGLQRLMEQEAFTENAADKDPQSYYEVYTSPEEITKAFASMFIVRGDERKYSIHAERVWTAFKCYLNVLGISNKPLKKEDLKDNTAFQNYLESLDKSNSPILRKDFLNMIEYKLKLSKRKGITINGEKKEGWKGIYLKDSWMEEIRLMIEARELGRIQELEDALDEEEAEESEDDKTLRACQICSKACKPEFLEWESARTAGP